MRRRVRDLLKERERIAAATAKRAALAEALAAAAKRRDSKLEEDLHAQAANSFAPPKQQYPQEFSGTQEHTDAEIAAANRYLILGLMLERAEMSPGQLALHNALPAAEQELWTEVRAYLRAQKASAESIHGHCEKVEQLDLVKLWPASTDQPLDPDRSAISGPLSAQAGTT